MKKVASVLLLLGLVVVGLDALRMTRPSNKPGKCPRARSLRQNQVRNCRNVRGILNECEADRECPADQKCCGCPKKCVLPRTRKNNKGKCLIRVPRRLPNFCASVGLINECSADSDCSRGESCCPPSVCGGGECVRIGGPERPQTCPIGVPAVLPDFCALVDIISECNSDKECSSRETCCPASECGGGKCTRLSQVKPPKPPRRCPIKVPRRLPNSCSRTTILNECNSDEECPRTETCCPSSRCGGGKCTRLRDNPSAFQCPPIPRRRSDICRRVRVRILCSEENPCDRGDPCCPGECGGTSCVRR